MRKELELTKLIESYLNGELTGEELKAFELRLNVNQKLREEVELQRTTMEALEGVMIRRSVQQAAKMHAKGKWMKGLGGAGILIGLAAVALFTWNFLQPDLPPSEEDGSELSIEIAVDHNEFNDFLEKQVFVIDAEEGGVVEGADGTVIAIPSDAFVDEHDETVEGEVQLVLQEAVEPTSIVRAGLSTTSNGEELVTAGMFYVGAFQGKSELQVAEGKDLMVDMLTPFDDRGMQLFDGEFKEDGSINWVDPEPIEKVLQTVPLEELDFYAPAFIPTLAELGFDIDDQDGVDSIFYSTTCSYERPSESRSEVMEIQIYKADSVVWADRFEDTYATEEAEREWDSAASLDFCSYIKPSSIRAIKEEEFQSTYVATKEFEERLRYLWWLRKEKYLGLYIENLDKPLWYTDSLMVFGKEFSLVGEFYELYLRRDGNVAFDHESFEKLQQIFEEKRELFRASAEEARKKVIEARQAEIREDQLTDRKFWDHERERRAELYEQELKLNLDEAYRQLGKTPSRRDINPNPGLTFPITNTGWKNVDQYVVESTLTRTTMKYEAPNGDKAEIKYEAFNVAVDQVDQYDEVVCYLLGDPQASFRKMMKHDDGTYNEKLNELIDYNLLVIGYKGEEQFVFSEEGIELGSVTAYPSLRPKGDVDALIRRLASTDTAKDLQTAFNYRLFQKDRDERRAKRLAKQEQERAVWRSIFCFSEVDNCCYPCRDLERDLAFWEANE
ncbi:MAG: hypothetical protein MK081_15105 [Flavobacteriales bacterium]|nr:hypothetical protein [Flavobacteriales bacterium]